MTGSAISIWMSEWGLRAARTRRAAVLITCAFSLGVMAPAASAASGPFQIGTVPVPSDGYDAGSLDVDANGTAYVAWPDYTKNVIDYCVLPDGASACAESGALSPVAGALTQTGNGVEVLVNNGSVSIIAAVAAEGNAATEWTEMWQAPDGTGNFTLVNGGDSVAYPDPKSNSPADLQDGVVVPGSGQLGVFDFTPGGPTSFEAFPQSSPPVCTESSSPACAFATLEPSSNPDPVSNFGAAIVGREVASESGPNPGILAIKATAYSTGPFACSSGSLGDDFSDVYMYGSGLQSPNNSYNISPGQPNSAWKVAATEIPGECPGDVQWEAMAGGPGGFGLFETCCTTNNGGQTSYNNSELDYLPFDQATRAFDEPAVTVDPNTGGAELGLAQDGAGNIYATTLLGGDSPTEAPLGMFYSADGGKTWQGPGALAKTLNLGFASSNGGTCCSLGMHTAVGSDGKGWMVITGAAPYGSIAPVYVVEFSAADVGNSFSAVVQPPPPIANRGVTVPLSCYTVPCTVTTALTATVAPDARFGHAASVALGTGSATITKHGVQELKIPLSAAGVAALEAHAGTLAVSGLETTAVGFYKEQKTVSLTLTAPVPVLSRLKISPRSLTAASSGATRKRASVGYVDTLAAKTRFVVAKREPGVLRGGVCGKPPRRVSGHPRSCRRWVSVGSFSHADKKGANTFHFPGRVDGHRLAAGSYRLEATPAFGGFTGETVWTSFAVRNSRRSG